MAAKKKSSAKRKSSKGSVRKRVKLTGALRDPLTGKFVSKSVASAKAILAAVKREFKKARSARFKAARKRFGGAKLPATRKRQDKAYAQAAKAAARLAQKLDKAERQLSATRAEYQELTSPLPEEMEIGVSYDAKKGPTSDVNFNIRVRRVDGLGITEADVRRALEAIATGNMAEVPSDLEVSGTDWTSPGSKRRSTRTDMSGDNAFAFSDIIATAIAKKLPIRVGEVKADRIGL